MTQESLMTDGVEAVAEDTVEEIFEHQYGEQPADEQFDSADEAVVHDEAVDFEEEKPKKKRTKRDRLNDQAVIRLLVKENPKRMGTKAYERFNLYRDGMLVRDALEAGVTTADIHYDREKNFIALEDSEQ